MAWTRKARTVWVRARGLLRLADMRSDFASLPARLVRGIATDESPPPTIYYVPRRKPAFKGFWYHVHGARGKGMVLPRPSCYPDDAYPRWVVLRNAFVQSIFARSEMAVSKGWSIACHSQRVSYSRSPGCSVKGRRACSAW